MKILHNERRNYLKCKFKIESGKCRVNKKFNIGILKYIILESI